jgi:adenylate cyclase
MNLIGRIRLYAGLILFAFVATHLMNHSLGIISVRAMDTGREAFLFVWRSWPGTVLLAGALIAHTASVAISAYRRRTWRGLSRADLIQYISGIAIPPLVVFHILANRGLHERFGLDDTYSWVLMALWHLDPLGGIQQAVLTIVAWTHACLGLHMWLRLKSFYSPCVPALYTASLLLLVLSLVGFVNGGQEVSALTRDPVWMSAYLDRTSLPSQAGAWAYEMRDLAWTSMIIFVIAFGVVRGGHHLWDRRQGRITVHYPEDRRISVEPGVSVLEASRRAGIPHASICGGRGRCSTCRVKIVDGRDGLPPMERSEARVLHRIGAPDGVRLACQLHPPHSIGVIPLLPQPTPMREAFQDPGYAQGAERRIAVLFADLRSFTRFAETKLPYDVVFVMNQYCRYMGEAVEQNGGRLDKFIGDGVMALFGIDSGPEVGAQQALATARSMSLALDHMNEALKSDLEQPMRLGIGVHVGEVILGEMGYRSVVSFTAIGDPVNTTSRLEKANKEFGSQLTFSVQTAEEAGLDMGDAKIQEIQIEGRDRAVHAYVLKSGQDLPALPGEEKPA